MPNHCTMHPRTWLLCTGASHSHPELTPPRATVYLPAWWSWRRRLSILWRTKLWRYKSVIERMNEGPSTSWQAPIKALKRLFSPTGTPCPPFREVVGARNWAGIVCKDGQEEREIDGGRYRVRQTETGKERQVHRDRMRDKGRQNYTEKESR